MAWFSQRRAKRTMRRFDGNRADFTHVRERTVSQGYEVSVYGGLFGWSRVPVAVCDRRDHAELIAHALRTLYENDT